MHHVVLDRWSRGRSWIHHRDARAKCLGLGAFLILVATSERNFGFLGCGYFLILAVGILLARLPFGRMLARSTVVLPFSGLFALIAWLGGSPRTALLLLGKSYLSALAVLLLIATCPLPQLLRALEAFRVPRFLLMVSQFLYRYLFVISEEAQHMRVAAASRGASPCRWSGKRMRFRAAAGALAVLFSRSYGHAEDIHRAMISRGFDGSFRPAAAPRFRWSDALFLSLATAAPLLLRLAAEVRPQ